MMGVLVMIEPRTVLIVIVGVAVAAIVGIVLEYVVLVPEPVERPEFLGKLYKDMSPQGIEDANRMTGIPTVGGFASPATSYSCVCPSDMACCND
jgi:hypothetical protein